MMRVSYQIGSFALIVLCFCAVGCANVLYDSRHPTTSMVAKDIAGHPRFDRPGMVHSGRPWALVGYLILPVLVISGHFVWMYLNR